jgi:hypothetical protein
LPVAERNLSILRFILQSTPKTSRWYPVMLRYVGAFANGVAALGGNPSLIPPSVTGTWPGWQGLVSGQGPPTGPPGLHYDLTGKIAGMLFDHFGDFEGFISETDSGDTATFWSRESSMKDLVGRAWAERLRVTVFPEHKHKERPHRIVVHPPIHPI